MEKENINKFNEKKLFDAKDLRTAKIAYNDAGCYKWWARETNVELLVKGLNKISKSETIDFNEVKNRSEKQFEKDSNSDFYCIYVGLSQNLRKRLNTHVNRTIRNSTLRKTLASVLEYYSHNNFETEIDEFIDNLKLSYIELPNENIDKKETELINEYFHILNNDKNNHKLAEIYGLKNLISEARAIAAQKNPVFLKKNKNK